jgi:hypothetical protein
MPLDIAAPTNAPAPLPLQYLSIQLMPLMGGEYSVEVQATLLDEEALEFVGQYLAYERVTTIDQLLAVIRQNVAALVPT